MITGKEIYENAVDHGFYQNIKNLMEHPHLNNEEKDFILHLWRTNRLMLMISEIAEGFEALRHKNFNGGPKSGSLEEEMADLEIRFRDFCFAEKIEIENHIEQKHQYNKTRPYKHGKVA